MNRMFQITELGRRKGTSPSPQDRNLVLDQLYQHKTASTEQISAATGIPSVRVYTECKRLAKVGLAQEIGG